MPATSSYVVTLTTNPGVQYTVSEGEYESLVDQNLVASLIGVTVPADQVFISDDVPPVSPADGLVWFNRIAP